MDYTQNLHHRRSIRLHGYDYSQSGLYFITIVVQNRLHLFGHIQNGKMILNDAGKMIERWYFELENKYPDKRCRKMIIMPNHFHCIIENMEIQNVVDHGNVNDVPISNECSISNNYDHFITNERERPITDNPNIDQQPEKYGMHNKKYGATIGDAINWFKTMTTNEYIRNVKRVATQGNPNGNTNGNTNNWPLFNGKLWQRNYWEHIIRDEQSYQRIANYIENNPAKWHDDKFYD